MAVWDLGLRTVLPYWGCDAEGCGRCSRLDGLGLDLGISEVFSDLNESVIQRRLWWLLSLVSQVAAALGNTGRGEEGVPQVQHKRK